MISERAHRHQRTLGDDAVKALIKGAETIANLVKTTLRPSGRNVVIGVRDGVPSITNDGLTIAKEVFLEDKIEDLGARVIREVSMQTNDKVGDGTHTVIVLAQAILNKGLEDMGDSTDLIRDHAHTLFSSRDRLISLRDRLTPSAPSWWHPLANPQSRSSPKSTCPRSPVSLRR